MRKKLSTALATVVLAVTTGTLAYANQTGKHDNDALVDLSRAQVPIAQAITTAEQAAGGGTATRAELENEKQGLIYEIEVANTGTQKVMDVRVDGVSGKVLSAREDRADHEGKDEPDDD